MDDHDFITPMDIDSNSGVAMPPATNFVSDPLSPTRFQSSTAPSGARNRRGTASRGPRSSTRKPKAPTIAEHAWESVKERIFELYVQDNQPLLQVVEEMRESHNFEATIRQYENRISKWGFDKKVKPSEMAFIIQRQQQRRAEEPTRRDLKFEVRGVLVTDDKITRAEKRNLPQPETVLSSSNVRELPIRELTRFCFLPTRVFSGIVNIDSQLPENLEYNLRQRLSNHGRLSGPTAPATLACLEDLGDFLHSQGRYKSAEDTFRKLAKARKSEQGVDSEPFIRAIQKLGDTLLCQGRAPDAEKILARAHTISKRLTGEDSPLTLGCLGSLASARLTLGHVEEARTAHLAALNTSTRVLGEQHLETLLHLLGAADACRAAGRLDEAEGLYRRLLQHADTTASSLSNKSLAGLAVIHTLRGQYADAVKLHPEALENVQGRGPQHPTTLSRRDDLAAAYCVSGRLHEAEKLCDEVFAEKSRVLGEEHPETILNRLLMANIRRRQGRLGDAETLCQQALERLERAFGTEHPRTVASMLLLVDIWQGQGQERRALELFERCVELRKMLLPEHPNTAMMVRRLEEWKGFALMGQGS
ncbi:hypothetical protein QBC34DRAFT_436679 [Podospora aff. communis PSN243]|uniref:Clr5 domain-containing protein n=1 Tax=Podospora aff. communis PSN243 TaxID=3040156 RepID=A0AAV9GTK9_9PEZI|nr:hypothetical protein QBC34DRAFT_436679 [Podospora aff. communis PSN243]